MKKCIVFLLVAFCLSACITTPTPIPPTAVKPSGDPPAPFEGPFPECVDEYLAWMKSYRVDWYNWFKENPKDIPEKYNIPCSGITPSPAPSPVSPAPTPEKPWWDYVKITPAPVDGYGSKANPVVLTQFVPALNGYGFNRMYGTEYTIPKGRIVSFKIDPLSSKADFAGKTFKLSLFNYESYRTNIYQGIIYRVIKTTGAESVFRTVIAGSNFQVSVILDHDPSFYYRIEVFENGLQDQPFSIWWSP